jgi:hypothetical protein
MSKDKIGRIDPGLTPRATPSLRISLIPTSVEEREKVSIPDSTNNSRTKSPWMGRGERSHPGSAPRMTTTPRARVVDFSRVNNSDPLEGNTDQSKPDIQLL